LSEREETVAVRVAGEGEPSVARMSSVEFVAAIRLHEKYSRGMRDGARTVLSHQDLSGLRLPNLNLRGAILVATDFSRADVSGTDFSHADLFTANFDGAKAEGANFEKADLRGAHSHGTALRGSNFRNADLRPGIFIRDPSGGKNPDPVSMNVAISRITEDPIVDMYGADLEGAELGGALMQRANLSAANLQGVKADGTRMNGANLRGSILADTDLSKTELYGAKVSRGTTNLDFDLQRSLRDHAMWGRQSYSRTRIHRAGHATDPVASTLPGHGCGQPQRPRMVGARFDDRVPVSVTSYATGSLGRFWSGMRSA